jgi:hypothetical protein
MFLAIDLTSWLPTITFVETAAQQISGGSSNQQITDDPSVQTTTMPMISSEVEITIDPVI